MKEIILDIIKASNGKINFGGLIRKLDIDNENLEKLLLELKLDGKILETSGKYSLFPNNMYIGKIDVTEHRNKVIFYDGKMISVASNFFSYVILNDVVSFSINDHGEAEITSIIDRKIRDVTCKVVGNGKKRHIECFYKGLQVSLPKDVMNNLNDGDIISVSIGLNDIDSGYCECKFKKIVGHASDPNIDEVMIASNYGFDNDYSQAYMDELAQIPTYVKEDDCIGRTDYRDLPFVTIDCVSAKDMDDAVYAYRFKNGGYRVYVSIADVTHFVKLYSEIFNRAFEKGNSCYINNCVFHMLHEVISNGICSLNEGEDRLTKTVVMDIDESGKVIDFNICNSVIKSRKKMDYDSVDKILINGEVPSGYEEYVPMIKDLYAAASILEKKAINEGKLDFPSDEVRKEYDEFGNVISVKNAENTPATKLIEYLMIAANVCVANYILLSCIPSAYRNHDKPNVRKVNETIRLINDDKDLKIKFKPIDSANHPMVIQAILHKLSNMDEYPVLASVLLQCMQRAVYSTVNIGHYALSENVYTHFTSPIRRLCDLMVHMVLNVLLGNTEILDQISFDELEELLKEGCKQATRMERQADVAEYDGNRLAIVKSMEPFIGYEYDAYVLEVADKIRLKVNGIDCFVGYKNLSDEFNFDDKSHRYYDRNNGMILKMGASVKVMLTDVNLTNRTINVKVLGVMKSKKLTKEY